MEVILRSIATKDLRGWWARRFFAALRMTGGGVMRGVVGAAPYGMSS